ncbi:MAG: GxxExxY protein [Planctomycetes bacterium]|nr:GxxExxY protein [Planctomycetota bacterium]
MTNTGRHTTSQPIGWHAGDLTSRAIAAAVDVHRALGPGLLESSYRACLRHELSLRAMEVECERPVPICYRGVRLDCGYRLDMVVERRLVLELKAVASLQPIHVAQVVTYLRLTGLELGLLLNFNVALMKHGIRRIVRTERGPAS